MGNSKAARVPRGLDFRGIAGSSSLRLQVVVNYAVLGEIVWIVPSSVKDTDCDAAIVAGNLACAVLIHPNSLCASVDTSLAKVFCSRSSNEMPCFKVRRKVLAPLALLFDSYFCHLDFSVSLIGGAQPPRPNPLVINSIDCYFVWAVCFE